ncbi:hypothetical protein A4X06_0g8782 [Tilletia controversa]|uniref:Thiaminase-2/PQQC domain-containing protein n=1 Tax=Tilletia controversa TaxID=13291 RepID=A0A8X7MK73_9BASI|nr:hypothetical protein CF328_g5678 [Tilletia controversa]KAE8238403.1 hypothetical protein A4X06_0g8782 [Tilletia controversa]
MIESKLTHHLLSLCPAEADRATTTHPFITSINRGTIHPDRLEAWLAQDRHYILRGYLPLMGSMLSNVPLPPTGVAHHLGPNADESGRYMRTVEVMGDAISNAIREAKFFEKTAADAGFDLSVGPPRPSTNPDGTQQQQGTTALPFHPLAPETDAYLNYMSRVAHTGTFLEQLTLLWAMEILYYRAWSQAASNRAKSTSTSFTRPQSEALTLLINNWSSAEFASFVEILGDLLDGYGGSGDITRLDSDVLARVQGVWRQVVHLEKGFWEAGRGAM